MVTVATGAVACTWPRLWVPVIATWLVVVLHRRRVSFTLAQTFAICGVAALLGLVLGLCLPSLEVVVLEMIRRSLG